LIIQEIRKQKPFHRQRRQHIVEDRKESTTHWRHLKCENTKIVKINRGSAFFMESLPFLKAFRKEGKNQAHAQEVTLARGSLRPDETYFVGGFLVLRMTMCSTFRFSMV
jgi:hypothetical protein